MANPLPSDSSEFPGRTAGQQPIVLARLPRVAAVPPTSAGAQTTTQTVPQPEAMPQLDLRAEIDQRTRLHIADTSDADPAAATSYFVDRDHAPDSDLAVREHAPAPRSDSNANRSQRSTHRTTHEQPATLSGRLFQLHAQLAPHAGLIVALALIASAGLLYWMIVGPAQPPLPHYDNFGTGLSDEGYGAAAPQMPDDYLPEFAVSESAAAEPLDADDQWTDVPLASPSSEEEPDHLAQPQFDPSALRALPPIDQSPFPASNNPDALDFTKAGPPLPSLPLTEIPQPLPEVAEAPNNSTTR